MHGSNFGDVGEFHKKFNLHYSRRNGEGVGPRTDLSKKEMQELLEFRIDFLLEEINEFIDAKTDADRFDALVDLVYVALGTAHLLGYPWQAGWDRVQEANMKKERATSENMSKRRSTLDVVKPEGWTPPDLEGLLAEYGF